MTRGESPVGSGGGGGEVRVEVRHRRHRWRVLGELTVPSVAALGRLAAEARVTLDLPGVGPRAYRVHGYEWDRRGDEVVGWLLVEP